jgi:3-oxoacyl-[acyl-carrier-protein] synthase II
VRTPLAVSGWSVISPLGIGARAFQEGITSGRIGLREPSGDGSAPCADREGRVPGFVIRDLLGRKNTRAMDRLTGLTVVTVGRLLESEGTAGQPADADETGLVLGTSTGSVQSMMDFTKDSFTRAKPYLVDPACFPNAVMNCAAGQTAIWYGLRGPNTTISGGQAAGLAALSYAARLHRYGRAESVLCGAAEELSVQRAWLESGLLDDHDSAAPLGEGCAVFRLEPPQTAKASGRRPLAYLLATAFRVSRSPSDIPGLLADCAASIMKTAATSAESAWAVAADLSEAQYKGISGVVGDRPRRISLVTTLGDTGAASAALHLSAVLAHASTDPASGDRLALVASADRDGLVGMAAFRLPPYSQE